MNAISARRRHPVATLVVIMTALVLFGGVYAVLVPVLLPALAPGGRAEASVGAVAKSLAVEEGRALYLEGCSSCHGLNAEGTSDGPTLIGVGAAAVDFQVATGRMPLAAPGAQAPAARRSYTDAEISQLAAYIGSLSPGPAIPAREEYHYTDADLQEGGELFRTNCASCHNFSGQGGALTKGKYAPSLEGVEAKHIYEAMITGPQSMPVFGDSTLTPEQKQNIIAFIKSIEDEPNPGGLGLGRLGPVSEGLAGWLIGMGALVAAAVWIGAKTS